MKGVGFRGRRRHGRRVPPTSAAAARRHAAPIVLAALLIGALGLALLVEKPVPSGADAPDGVSAAHGTGAAASSPGFEREAVRAPSAGADDEGDRAHEGDGGEAAVDAGSFLNALTRRAAQADEDGADIVISWSDASDVPVLAEAVLAAYRDDGSASLMASGYLDLSGNAWAALLWDGSRWVDVVSVVSSGEGATARIVRMLPASGEEMVLDDATAGEGGVS